MAYAAVSFAGVSSCSRSFSWSSAAAFSARSSFRIEATRISQTRRFESVFLLSYSRLRSSPSTWICAPLVSVLEFRELAEDDAAVPFRVRDVLAILFVGGLGCQRKSSDAEIRAVGTPFWVAAEEADESYFVLIHDCLRLLNFPILIGAPLSEWAMLPSAEALHLRRLRRNLFGVLSEQDLEGNRNPQGGAAKAEERARSEER